MARVLIVALLMTINSFAFCSEKELFKVVNDSKARKIFEYNRPYIDKKIYYAKRYKIVTVNEKLLMDGEPEFQISPFEDIKILVETENLDPPDDFGFIVWRGIQKNWQSMRLSGPNGEKIENGEETIRNFLGVTFYSHAWDVNEVSGEAMHPAKNSYGGLSDSLDRSIKKNPNIHKKKFRTISGSFKVLGKGEFHVTPLKYTPKYHLVYELDRSGKAYNVDTPENQLRPETKMMLLKQQEYLRSLPEEDGSRTVVEDIK